MKRKWYQKTWVIILSLFLFFPLGVALLLSNEGFQKRTKIILSIVFGIIFLGVIIPGSEEPNPNETAIEESAEESGSNEADINEIETNEDSVIVEEAETSEQITAVSSPSNDNNIQEKTSENFDQEDKVEENNNIANESDWTSKTIKSLGLEDHKEIIVDGGDQSGYREPNVKVDTGFGDREYYAFTNEHSQLVAVIAENIIPQNDDIEPVTSQGRYYHDEAKVPGTEHSQLDEGHVIADSLGGVANAYNITPQDSTLNRHGDQAYMEDWIRKAGGCSNFVAIISYPDNETQIPSHYEYTYILQGNEVVDSFDNINPDPEQVEEVNQPVNNNAGPTIANEPVPIIVENDVAEKETEKNDVSKVDANGNGTVTIAEAKAAGYSMPIMSDHWLYPYMIDGDGDGMVGE